MRIILAIVSGLLYLQCGCSVEPTRPTHVAAHVEPVTTASRPADEDDATRAMRPFLGRWLIDVEATVEASRALPDDRLRTLVGELQRHPFTLEVTANRYVSRSREYVRDDRYEAIGCDDAGAVVIELTQASGVEPTTVPRRHRSARLLLRDGRLFVGPNEGFTVVFVKVH